MSHPVTPLAPAGTTTSGLTLSGPRLLWLLLGGVLLVRVLLVLGSGAGLHVDEAQYWDWSRDLQWGYYSKPPVIAALIRASTTLFGDGAVGVRVLAMLCWVLTAAALYGLAAQLMRDAEGSANSTSARQAGTWAALLFVSTPLCGVLGLSATTDAPLLLCWVLATWQLWLALRRGGGWRWAVLGGLLGLGLLSKYTMLALLPGLFWLAWRTGPAARRGSLLALAVAALICAPNLAWNGALGWPTLQHTADITARTAAAPELSLASRTAALAEYLGGQLLLAGPVLGPWLLLLGGQWLGKRWRALGQAGSTSSQPPTGPWGAAGRHLWLLSWPLMALGLVQALHSRAQVNWTAAALPGLLVWLALQLAQPSPGRWWTGARRWAVGAIALNLVLVLLVTGAPIWARGLGLPLPARLDVWARMRGWQDAFDGLAPALQRQLSRQPDLPVLGASRDLIAQGAWAWRGQPVHWRAWHPAGLRARHHYELTVPLDALPDGSALLVLSDDEPLDPELRRHLQALQPLASAPRRLSGRPDQILILWQARLCHAPCPPDAGASR